MMIKVLYLEPSTYSINFNSNHDLFINLAKFSVPNDSLIILTITTFITVITEMNVCYTPCAYYCINDDESPGRLSPQGHCFIRLLQWVISEVRDKMTY